MTLTDAGLIRSHNGPPQGLRCAGTGRAPDARRTALLKVLAEDGITDLDLQMIKQAQDLLEDVNRRLSRRQSTTRYHVSSTSRPERRYQKVIHG